MITVQLYTTLGCHLCEQALALLNALHAELDLVIESVEIAESDELVDALRDPHPRRHSDRLIGRTRLAVRCGASSRRF